MPESTSLNNSSVLGYSVNPNRVADARWDEASRVAIQVTTKPCPKCRTPTERSGGCMHMVSQRISTGSFNNKFLKVCTRAGCAFEWCWVCQTEWTRDCMAGHWFG